MAKFVASKRLSKLEFDFGPEFSPDPRNPLRGIVPEPSRRAVIEFNDTLANNLSKIGKEVPDPTARLEIIRMYARLTVEELEQLDEHTKDAIQEVTANTPPREELDKLGSRALTSFQEWLQNELNSPEAPTPVS